MRHKISEIKIEKVASKDGLIGFCSFIIDEKFRFNSVAIFSRFEGGIRLSWPEKKRGLKRIVTAAPVHPASFKHIEEQISEAMNNAEQNNAINQQETL